MQISLLGGKNEIGGNKVLVEDKNTRIFLDFGESFSHLDKYFVAHSYLYPRTRFGLKDYFEFDLMPKLSGLYSKQALEHSSIEYKEPEFQAVFISHAHFDHIRHIKFLDPKIPIHIGETALKIIRSTETTSGRYILPTNADIHRFRTGKTITVGEIKVTPIHVDHSVPGAYGFIVECSDGTIAYTGDIRKHGPRADMTEDFLKKAEGVDKLIIDGTRIGPKDKRKYLSEEQVYKKASKIVKNSEDSIITSRYPKDLDRFRSFYEMAKQSSRKLAISARTAHLLLALKNDEHIALPDPLNDKDIVIYGRLKKIYGEWEKQMLKHCVNSRYVSRRPNELILELDFYTLPELIDIQPKKGEFIYSMSEPIEEDPLSQISDEVLSNWLKHFNLKRHQIHASGHASMDEVFEIIERLNPKKVIPIHTEHPEIFKKRLKNVEE